MPKPPRRPKVSVPRSAADVPQPPYVQTHVDPVGVAARVMLSRALAAAGSSFEEAGRDGNVCCVVVRSTDWVDPVVEAWRESARFGTLWSYGSSDIPGRGDLWALWQTDQPKGRAHPSPANDVFARWLVAGYHCLGVTEDPDLLPSDLIEAANVRLRLDVLDDDDIAGLVAEMFGRPAAERLTHDQAVALTPRLLRLARRRDQSPDAYVARLRALTQRGLVVEGGMPAPAPSSPRAAPTLDRLHGMDEAVAWGLNLARDLRAFTDGRIAWADVDRGCLLSGPPGCGKTLFARALSATCGVPLVTGSYADWLGTRGGHLGDLMMAMKKSFADARSGAPAILFIDEIDSFPDRTAPSRWQDWNMDVVNALLAEIDGVSSGEGVVVIGACNHPDRLDPALIRSGRLDRHVRVGLPDRPALELILREHLGGDLPDISLMRPALAALGSSGADCERMVRDARRRARTAGRALAPEDLIEAIGDAEPGSERDRKAVAVHEAGHAVALCCLEPSALRSVTVRKRGHSLGRSSAIFSANLVTAADLHRRLTIYLSGRAAEDVLLGEVTSGAGGDADSDLARATLLAVTAGTAYGLDGSGELVWTGLPTPEELPRMLAFDRALADRVAAMIARAYGDASDLLRHRLEAVQAVTAALLRDTTIEAAGVIALVSGAGQP